MIILTDENFEKELSSFEKPVLVDFFAVWCLPCSVLSPILEKMESEFGERVIFTKVNVDSAPQTSQKYGINPIPTVILFKKGNPFSEFVGLKPESEIREWLENHLKENGN
jgi:thioredoxin